LLLVEAALAAVVIAVGLTFISRGLGSQLKALRAVEEQDRLLSLAAGRLQELEAARQNSATVPPDRTGRFPAPHSAYQWALAVAAREGPQDLRDTAGVPLTSDVTLRVQRAGEDASAALRAVFPSDWLPPR
jgi:hypothetical protein